MKKVLLTCLAGTLFAGLVGLYAPSDANACGGTFCDTGPQAMPVDQTGENILFVINGGTVEAHIQIQYSGEAAKFAWVLPLQNIPEFYVGSQPLFNSLLAGSVPTYGYNSTFEDCGFDGGATGGASNGGGGGSGGAAGSAGGGGGPSVVYQRTVGAYDITVLQGGTASEVMDWLNSNGYQQNPAAEPILADYLSQPIPYVFAAVKLTGNAGVTEIHPLVVRYQGDTPCVPLKLTAVAAKENMGVRTFFLGQNRVVATTYKNVEPNPVRFDWQNFANNYNDVITRAVDAPVADGKAFVTEYAGTSNVVSLGGVYSDQWNSNAFTAIAPTETIATLQQQGLMYCYYTGYCEYYHPLLKPLLQDYLPTPAGVEDDLFYYCLQSNCPSDCTQCYNDQIDTNTWNGLQFAQTMEQRIVAPGKHARDLLQENTYLTRLYTTISPAEMTLDPEFMEVAGLPDVASIQTANRTYLCTGREFMELPDSRFVAHDKQHSDSYPQWDDVMPQMPLVQRVVEYSSSGSEIVLQDKNQLINDLLAQWNLSQGYPPGGMGGTAGTAGSSGSSGGNNVGGSGINAGGNSGSSAGGASGSSGVSGSAGTIDGSGTGGANSANPDDDNVAGGCSTTPNPSNYGAAWLALLCMVGLMRRKP